MSENPRDTNLKKPLFNSQILHPIELLGLTVVEVFSSLQNGFSSSRRELILVCCLTSCKSRNTIHILLRHSGSIHCQKCYIKTCHFVTHSTHLSRYGCHFYQNTTSNNWFLQQFQVLCKNVSPSSSFSLFCIITAPATSHLNLQSQGQGLGSLLILKQ